MISGFLVVSTEGTANKTRVIIIMMIRFFASIFNYSGLSESFLTASILPDSSSPFLTKTFYALFESEGCSRLSFVLLTICFLIIDNYKIFNGRRRRSRRQIHLWTEEEVWVGHLRIAGYRCNQEEATYKTYRTQKVRGKSWFSSRRKKTWLLNWKLQKLRYIRTRKEARSPARVNRTEKDFCGFFWAYGSRSFGREARWPKKASEPIWIDHSGLNRRKNTQRIRKKTNK